MTDRSKEPATNIETAPDGTASAQPAPVGDAEIRRPEFGPDWVHTRGAVIQRVFSHDVAHVAELNEVLGEAGLPLVNLWD